MTRATDLAGRTEIRTSGKPAPSTRCRLLASGPAGTASSVGRLQWWCPSSRRSRSTVSTTCSWLTPSHRSWIPRRRDLDVDAVITDFDGVHTDDSAMRGPGRPGVSTSQSGRRPRHRAASGGGHPVADRVEGDQSGRTRQSRQARPRSQERDRTQDRGGAELAGGAGHPGGAEPPIWATTSMIADRWVWSDGRLRSRTPGRKYVKLARMTLTSRGGHGAVRELCQLVLDARRRRDSEFDAQRTAADAPTLAEATAAPAAALGAAEIH